MENSNYIEKYFEGNLTKEEEAQFNKLLKEDTVFSQEFEFEQNVKKAISLHMRAKLKQKLQGFEEAKKNKKSYKLLYVAASFALLLGFFIWQNSLNNNFDSLYDAYYHTYPNTVLPTIRGQSSESLKSKAFYAYDSENYEQAIIQFTEIYTKEKSDYALFYKALSLMEIQKYKEALDLFDTLEDNKKSQFTPFIMWYSALSNLKLENKEKAIKILKELVTTANPQQELAKKLLEDLK